MQVTGIGARALAHTPLEQLASTHAAAAWSGTHGHAGLTARLDAAPELLRLPGRPAALVAHGSVVTPTGERAGTFQRTLLEHPDGTRTVHHDKLFLAPEHHRTGFGSAFDRASDAHYAAWGVSDVRMVAAGNGPYTWARNGYDFDVGDADAVATLGPVADVARARLAAELVQTARDDGRISGAQYLRLSQRLVRDGTDGQPLLAPMTLRSAADVANLPFGLGAQVFADSGAWKYVRPVGEAAPGA